MSNNFTRAMATRDAIRRQHTADQMRTIPALPPETEKQWTRVVCDLAGLRGWWAYHPYDSRRSQKGWPDWTFIRPPRMVCAELKTDKGRLRPEQRYVLDLLQVCDGVEAYLWRPADFDQVKEVLW